MADAPSDSTDADAPDAPEADAAASASPAARWGRRIGAVIGSLGLVLAAAFLVLQTETGATATARFLADQFNPLPGTELTVERAGGTWLGSLRLVNVELTRTDSTSGERVRLAAVDTLEARYSLLPLLRNHLLLHRVRVAGPSATLRQGPDGAWDWSHVLPPAGDDTTASAFRVSIGAVDVRRGALTASFYAPETDSTARLSGLHLSARDLEIGDAFAGRLDSLGLRGRVPGDSADLRLAARGALQPDHLRLDTLRLDSPRSHLRGGGTVRLSRAPGDSLDDVRFTLRADPLSFRDVRALAPPLAIDPAESLTLDLSITGTGSLLRAQATAAFQPQGSATLQATATPRTTASADHPLHYRVDARIRNATTSLLGSRDTSAHQLTAHLFTDVSGASLDDLSGPLRLQVDRSRLGGIYTGGLTATAAFRNGEAAVQVDGSINDARLDLDGRLRPFDRVPTYRTTARIRGLDLRRLADTGAPSSDVNGTVSLAGRGLTPETHSLDASARLTPSRLGRQSIPEARLQARLRPDSLTFDGTMRLPDGRLSARGRADLRPPYPFAVDTLRMESVHLASLAGDTTASSMTASARLRGRGRSADDLQLTADLRVDEGRYGSIRITDGEARTTLADGRLDASLRALLNGGRWSLEAEAQPFADVLTARIRNGRFTGVDPGAFAAAPPEESPSTRRTSLNGSFEGSLRGTTPAALQADLAVRLDTSRIEAQPVRSGSLDVSLAGGQLDARTSLTLPDGAATLAAAGRPFDDVPAFELTEGSFRNLDVGALGGLSGQTTSLTGQLTGEASGADWSTARGSLRVDLGPSRINRARLATGRLSFTAEDGRARLSGSVDARTSGRLRLDGSIADLDATPTYELTGSAGALDVSALAGLDTTLTARADTLQWSVSGRGFVPSQLSASARVASGPVQIDRLRLQGGRLDGAVDNGTLRLDTLDVRSNAVDAAGRGRLAYADTTTASDFDLVVGVKDARPLRRLLGADRLRLTDGRASLHVYGPPGSFRFDGASELRRLRYDDLRLADLDVRFNGAGSLTDGIQRADLRGTLGLFAAPTASAENTELTVGYTPEQIDVRTRLRLDRRQTATLSTRLTPDPDAPRLTVDALSLRLGPDRWELLQPAVLSYETPYRISRFLLSSGDQQIAADGSIDPDGRQSLIATIEQFRLDPIASLFGFPGLGGRLSGSVSLSGSAASPRLDGRLDASLTSEGDPVGTLGLDVGYDSLAVSVDALLEHTTGQQLTARGRLPADLRLDASTPVEIGDRPVSLRIAGTDFPVDWVDPFLDPETVRDVGGTLDADVEIGGTLNTPDLAGRASVQGAQAFLPDLGVAYRRGTGSVTFEGGQAQVERAVVRTTNGGRLEADGTVDFSNLTVGEFNLDVRARNFVGIDTRAYRSAVLDGRLTLRGTTRRPVLDGTVSIQQADVFYTEALAETASELTTVQLSEDDQLLLEERFGLRLTAADTTTFDAYEALAMDLSVQIRGDTWLRSDGTPEMDIQFRGDLDLEKESDQDAQVFGTMEVVTARSTVQQFGREFDITEGTLTFNGDPTMPYLDLAAVYRPRSQGTTNEPSVEITLSLEGQPDDLTPRLTSEPPMYTRDILSYLATGRPADQVLGGGGDGSLTSGVPRGLAAGFAENFAANRLGLDVVRFEYSAEGDWYLTVGQYLTPRLYVAVEQSVGSGFADRNALELVPDLTLEYQVTPYMQLRTVRRQSSLRFNVFLEYAY